MKKDITYAPNMGDQRLVWNPVVHDPLSARPRTPYTLFAEIKAMNELCREAKKHLRQLEEKEANDLIAAEELEEGEVCVVLFGLLS